jgi:tetratricopeptide (TPR) repeat protein
LIAQTNGNYPTALEYYDQALKVDQNFQPAVYNRALVLRDLGRIDEAIVELRKVVAADPKSVGGLYNLGVLLIAQGNAQEGTRLVNKAIELDPSLRNS